MSCQDKNFYIKVPVRGAESNRAQKQWLCFHSYVLLLLLFFLTAFNLMSVTTPAFDFLPWTPAPLSFPLTLSPLPAKAVFYFAPIQGPFNKSQDPLKQSCSAGKFQLFKGSFKSKFLQRSCCLQKAQLNPGLNAAYLTQDEDGKILFCTYQALFINKQTVQWAQGVSWASFAPHSHWPQVFYSVSHSFYCPWWAVPLHLEVGSKGWHFCDPS